MKILKLLCFSKTSRTITRRALPHPKPNSFGIISRSRTELNQNHITTSSDNRAFKRINQKRILDEEILICCKNLTSSRNVIGQIVNLSQGGMLLRFRHHKIHTGDRLEIRGRIGRSFKLDEKVLVKSVNGNDVGVTFVNSKKETSIFLNSLIGALGWHDVN